MPAMIMKDDESGHKQIALQLLNEEEEEACKQKGPKSVKNPSNLEQLNSRFLEDEEDLKYLIGFGINSILQNIS